ncbi:unnamed protein product [Polarella glacialis]|uniref:Ammonium transporter AmtB-like domain-containing protein n=1 Tax=Polarella glacialis TaxID=89957 RepID=A0A813JGF9_POLGL|nr:unnamed protein product [Polarella glacialis]
MATIIATILLCVMAPVVSAEVSLPLPDVQSSAEDADLLTLQFEFLNLKARVKAQKSVLTQQDTQLAELLAMPLAQGRLLPGQECLQRAHEESHQHVMGTLGWWVFGWALAYGGPYDENGMLSNKVIGLSQFLGMDFLSETSAGIQPTGLMQQWFFQWAFCTAAATIVSGGVAERVKSPSYGIFAFIMASFIYPVVVASTWGRGWLVYDMELGGSLMRTQVGFTDFAGSGVVHLTGGISALAGTFLLGPRMGRFEHPSEFEAHSLPLVVLGTFIQAGCFRRAPRVGSTLSMHSSINGAQAAQVAMNTTLSAAIGGIVVFSLRYGLSRPRKYDVGALCNGILAGLVSVTAGCATMESGYAIVTGIIYQIASMLLVGLKIDDPVDASAVHGACGAWGMMAAVLFDWGTGFQSFHGAGGFDCAKQVEDDSKCARAEGALLAQFITILFIILWSGALSLATFGLMKYIGLLRVDVDTEEMGMDAKMHSPTRAYIMNPSQPEVYLRAPIEIPNNHTQSV